MSARAHRTVGLTLQRLLGLLALQVVVFGAIGCQRDSFKEPLVLGGTSVSARTLNRGHRAYLRYCVGCHGRKGDGNVPGQEQMNPMPRDFTKGRFKYTSVLGDQLPPDRDLLRLLRTGVPGTHMPSWSTVEPAELKAIVQYIKTFSPRWRKEKVGTPLPLPHDPWARDADKARRRGRVVYHGVARCWQCHPSYLGEDEIRRLQSRLPVNERLPLRANPRQPLSVPTEYGPTLAPAFKKYQLRGGNRPSDVFRTIATGIPGTPMPAWHPKLSGRELWALTHYVRSLVGLEPGIKDNESQTRVNRK